PVALAGVARAQTKAAPAPVVTLPARQALELTATAAAFPVAPEQVDAYGLFVFGIGTGSLLIVLIPLALALWRMNRGQR
ncbi:MAG: hypothetical protein MUE40_07615, partial [Anaerolineae bacterium]|nr:hypothetical protein [Anaerolineae bacterium]